MKITIDGKIDSDPRSRVLALEAVTQSICEQFGMDAAEGAMMLLTAAVHLFDKHAKLSVREDKVIELARVLGYAIVAADDMFKLRAVERVSP